MGAGWLAAPLVPAGHQPLTEPLRLGNLLDGRSIANDVLLPVNDFEKAIGIHRCDVARVQPPVFKRFRRCIGTPEIAIS